MREPVLPLALGLPALSGATNAQDASADAPAGEITVWSWNVATSALEAVAAETDLRALGSDEDLQARLPNVTHTEFEPGGVFHAMPWDAGPVAMLYRRDVCGTAGVDPADIVA